MQADDHLVVFPKSTLYLHRNLGTRAQVSVMVVEPRAVHRRHLYLLRLFHRRFYRILTRDRALLGAIPNGIRFCAGGTFISDWQAVDTAKSRMVSLIASNRRQLEGHQLRHRVVEKIRAAGLHVEVMGRGYRPFADKEDGLAPYRYSIVIENARESGYFTEKLIDAFLCETVPIYWGAPDIGAYFDRGGMIVCQGLDEIIAALVRVSKSDYEERRSALAENRRRAVGLADPHRAAALAIRESLAPHRES